MISKPINSVLKTKFQSIHKAAIEKAANDFKVFKAKLDSLDNHFDKFKLLHDEDERLDKLEEAHTHPYYWENHNSEDWLLNQYASRSFLLNVDEAENLSEAIYLGHYSWKITDLKFDLRKEIPEYTYQDFLQGKICDYLNTFDHDYNIPKNDYYKIRNWQAERLVKIVNYEYRTLVRKIQQYCTTLVDPLNFILEEKEKIEAIDKVPADAKQLKEKLSELYIYNNFDFTTLDDKLLVKNFEIYKDERITWQDVYPALVKPLLDKVDNKYKRPFGSETTLFFVINKVADWCEIVLNGQSIQQEVTTPDWNALFEKLLQEAKQVVEETSEPINDYAYNEELPREDVKDYLIDKLEIYRRKFNAFEKKYLFALMEEEKRDILKRMFITNAFFGNDLQGQYKDIKEAKIIHEMSWEIVGTYGDIFDTHKVDYPEKRGAHLEIMSLMNQMVLDKELYNELRHSMDDFMQHFHSYMLPLEMHFQNQRETMSDLFRKSLSRLETHLDDAEPTNKILYLQSRLKELRQRELYYKQIKHELDDDDDDLRYSTLFKEFLEIEADFIKNTKDVDGLPVLTYAPKKQFPLAIAAANTFDETFPGEKGQFVMQLLEDLSITVDGKAQLAPKKVGAIRGVVEALRQNRIAPQLNLNALCCMIADKIGTQIKSGKIDASNTSEDFLKQAKQYISANYKPSKTV